MKYTILIFLLMLFVSTCAKTEIKPGNSAKSTPTAAPTAVIPKDGSYNAKGVVTKIDLAGGTIEIDHEEITGLMPKMIMEFHTRDKALLNGIKIGDKVEFVLEYKHPTETIVSIKKSQ